MLRSASSRGESRGEAKQGPSFRGREEGGREAAASLAGRNRGCGVKDKGDNSDLVRRGWRRRVGGRWTCRASNKYRGRDLNWLSQLLSSHRLSATPPSLSPSVEFLLSGRGNGACVTIALLLNTPSSWIGKNSVLSSKSRIRYDSTQL